MRAGLQPDATGSIPSEYFEHPNGKVWKGKSTQLISGLGIATPMYPKIFNALKEMGCIEQLRRGGGKASSVWAVFDIDIENEFPQLSAEGKGRLRFTPIQIVAQRVKDLQRVAQELEVRIERLERNAR